MRHTITTLAACLTASCAFAGPRVALVSASTITADAQSEPRFTDPRDKLVGTGAFDAVDIISVADAGDSVGTPTLEQLLEYDAVMTWTNFSYDDSTAMGNVLADYVDAGGGVVVALYANTSTNPDRVLQGRWQTGDYIAIPQGGGFTVNTSANIGTILIPGHPIFDEVAQFINDVGFGTNGPFGAWRPTTTAITPGSTKVATYSDGKTLVAIAPNQKVVELGFHPVSSAVNDGYWNETSDGAQLMANALLFVARSSCPADVNDDGVASPADFTAWLSCFNDPGSAPFCDRADVNADGTIDPADFTAWLAAFNAGCG